jgi:hypothetical protein
MNYKQLDKLESWQDTLLAIASWDWVKFHDARVFRLMQDWGIENSVQEVFEYYMGHKPEFYELNNNRYVQQYKQFLQSIV